MILTKKTFKENVSTKNTFHKNTTENPQKLVWNTPNVSLLIRFFATYDLVGQLGIDFLLSWSQCTIHNLKDGIELWTGEVDELRGRWKLRNLHCWGMNIWFKLLLFAITLLSFTLFVFPSVLIPRSVTAKYSSIVLFFTLQIIDGKDLLNERTNTELRYLKKAWSLIFSLWTHNHMKFHSLRICLMLLHHFFGFDVQKPESWRLACQTIVGNKENSGKVWQYIFLNLEALGVLFRVCLAVIIGSICKLYNTWRMKISKCYKAQKHILKSLSNALLESILTVFFGECFQCTFLRFFFQKTLSETTVLLKALQIKRTKDKRRE